MTNLQHRWVAPPESRGERNTDDEAHALFREAKRRRRKRRILCGAAAALLACTAGAIAEFGPPGPPKSPLGHFHGRNPHASSAPTQSSPSSKSSLEADSGPPIGSVGLIGSKGVWLVTGDGLFLSKNNGASWTYSKPPSGGDPLADYLDVDFISASQGWVVAASQAGVVIDRTADGGLTWNSTALPAALFGGGYRSAHVDFANTLDGWVAVQPWKTDAEGLILFHSDDGGSSWSVETEAAPVSVTKFTSPLNGWGLSPDSTELYRTTDGGLNWQPVELSPELSSAATHESWRLLTSPTFFGSIGYFLAVPLSGDAVVEVTTNGGATWSAHKTSYVATAMSQDETPSPLTEAAQPLCLGCAEPFAAASPNVVAYWGGDAMYVSTNGGRTWKARRPKVVVQGFTVPTGARSSSVSTAELQFTSASSGMVVATSRQDPQEVLLRTVDGGRNFTEVELPFHSLPS
jgi:photosystem II stability/assembly factor-like uncharacterized protein